MSHPGMDEIYTAYRSKVMGYIHARISSYADSEDICADVFEKIHLKLGDYDSSKASLSTWIYTITRNCVIDFYRRSKPHEELSEELPDNSEVDEGLLRTETLTELAEALGRLPSQQRDIIVLRYYDGKPLTEIAEILGLSYGATKLRHNAALAQLRKEMRELVPLS